MSWDKNYTTFEDVLNGEEEFIHCKGERVESMHIDLCTDVRKNRKRRKFSPDCCRISRGGKMQGHLFKVRINKGNGKDLHIKATWNRWGRCFKWAHVTKIPNSMRMHWGVLEVHLRSDQSAACCWIVSQQAVKGLSKGWAENLTSLQSILDKHVRWRQKATESCKDTADWLQWQKWGLILTKKDAITSTAEEVRDHGCWEQCSAIGHRRDTPLELFEILLN